MPPGTLDRLRAALALPPGEAKLGRSDLAEVLRLAETAERLRRYAVHRPDCRFHTERRPYGSTTVPGPCSCGLSDVVAGRFPGEADPASLGRLMERRKGPG